MFDLESEILTVTELMEVLLIGENYAYRLLNDKKIKAFRVGRSWRIPRYAITDYINSSIKQEA